MIWAHRRTKTKCEICSKLTIKTPERCHWRCVGVFIVNFEHISHLVPSVSIVNLEHVIAGCVETLQTMEILLLKALREEDFGQEPWSAFFSSDLHKFKLEKQLKALSIIVDEKEVGRKDGITIISSLNASQKLLVSEVLEFPVSRVFRVYHFRCYFNLT